ncbi:hypothetical protein QQ045_023908 [Rhodiola kirilowii]
MAVWSSAIQPNCVQKCRNDTNGNHQSKRLVALVKLGKGREVHGHLVKLGALDYIYVANSILGIYCKWGAGDDAVKVFERMRYCDGVSWNSMISRLNQAGEYVELLRFFSWMMWESVFRPSRVACLSALSACASIGLSRAEREIHAYAMKCGFDIDEFVN